MFVENAYRMSDMCTVALMRSAIYGNIEIYSDNAWYEIFFLGIDMYMLKIVYGK